MSTNESMGGIIGISFIPVDSVKLFSVVMGTALIRLNSDWYEFKAAFKKTEFNIEPTDDDAGENFEHKLSIYIPLGAVDADFMERYYAGFFKYGLIKYSLWNGEERILGSKHIPLKLSAMETNPSKAEDFNGYKLSFSTKDANKQVLVKQI